MVLEYQHGPREKQDAGGERVTTTIHDERGFLFRPTAEKLQADDADDNK